MIWFLLQAAQPAPDIQFELRVEAREVQTEVDGDARLTVRAEPDGGSVDKTVRTPPTGGTVQRDVRIVTTAEARIADPLAEPATLDLVEEEQFPRPATPEPDLR